MTTRIEKRSAVPWWAAFGAPLVGVPILVGLLALGSAGSADAGVAKDPDPGYASERSESLQATVDLPPEWVEAVTGSHC